jgi:hypothetical protein
MVAAIQTFSDNQKSNIRQILEHFQTRTSRDPPRPSAPLTAQT